MFGAVSAISERLLGVVDHRGDSRTLRGRLSTSARGGPLPQTPCRYRHGRPTHHLRLHQHSLCLDHGPTLRTGTHDVRLLLY